jgi:putative flippase GtrA
MKAANIHWRLLARFFSIGVVNTAFGYGVYCLLIAIGLPFPIAGLFALVLGIVWSFVTTGKVVFRRTLQGRFHRYVAVWAVIYIINVLAVWIGIRFGLNAYLAGASASLPTILAAFLLQHYFVFAEET